MNETLCPMNRALFDALYVNYSQFQWIVFTQFEVVPGRLSRPHYKTEWRQAKNVGAVI